MSIDIKITKEEKCVRVLCSLLDALDSLVVAIGSNNTTFNIDDVATPLLSEEIRWNNMEESTKYSLMIIDQLDDKGNGKSSNGESKSMGRSKSLG